METTFGVMDLQASPEVARSPVTFREKRGWGFWSVLIVVMAIVFVGYIWARSIPIRWAALILPVVIFVMVVAEWRNHGRNYVRVHDWGIEVGDWIGNAGFFGALMDLFTPSWSKKIEYGKIRTIVVRGDGWVEVGHAGPDARSYRQFTTLRTSGKHALSEMMSRFDFRSLQPVDKF